MSEIIQVANTNNLEQMMELSEVLKTLGRPIDTACKLIESLLGEPFRIAGDAISDQVSMWQWQNRLKIMDRASEILRERAIENRPVNPEFLLPFVRDCGDAASESLQEVWAKLLAAAVATDLNEHVAFVNTLHNLSSNDVKVLNALIELGFMERDLRPEAIARHLVLPVDVVKLSIYNIDHLGFFTATQRRLKGFAVSFLRACISDDTAIDKYLDAQKAVQRTLVTD